MPAKIVPDLCEVPTSPRTHVPKMCGGIQKRAEIVRNWCGRRPAQFSQNIGVGLPRMSVHSLCAIPQKIGFCTETKLYRQRVSQVKSSLWGPAISKIQVQVCLGPEMEFGSRVGLKVRVRGLESRNRFGQEQFAYLE